MTEPIDIRELPEEFPGKGETKGDYFTQILKGKYAYLYERLSESGTKSYEVFKKNINTQFNTISYPRSKSFGLWAWQIRSLKKAIEKFKNLNDEINRTTDTDNQQTSG